MTTHSIDTDWVGWVEDMHAKFGTSERAVHIVGEQLQDFFDFRVSCIEEELSELRDSVWSGDPEGVVDALIDMCVFAIGTLHLFGVDARRAWSEVMTANMAKVPGVKPGRPNPYGFPDLVKPEGWVGPSHAGNHGRLPEVLPQ